MSRTWILVNLVYTCSWNSDLSFHSVLTILLRYIHVFQWFNQLVKHTLCVSYPIVLIMGIFRNSAIISERLIEQWYNETLRLSYYTNIHLISFVIWAVKKSDTMGYLPLPFVNLGYTCSWNSNLSRQFVLAILLK